MNVNEKKAYDITAFCQQYSIGRTRLYEEIKTGRLQIKKIGRRTIIPASAAESWMESLGGELSVSQLGARHDAS